MAKELTTRDSLAVNHIYFEEKSGQYFVTPDGIGCYWYDTFEEAQGQHGSGPVTFVWELED